MTNQTNRAALYRPKRLTEEGVNKLKPPTERQYENHYDAQVPGLVLRVNSGGSKVWHAQYYTKTSNKDGKRVTIATTHKLGRYPILNVKEAREKARLFLANPHKALTQAASGSFREVAENFVKRYVEANKDRNVPLRSKPEIERCLAKYIYPVWQHLTFREIKRSDVTALLDGIEDNHGARQADVVLAIIRKMMNWFTTRDDDYVSPVVRGMHRANSNDRKRKRIIGKDEGKDDYNDEEFRAFWKACGDAGTFGALLKVLVLTAQRREKVATMKWDDIVDGRWTIASEAREKANAGTLKLPQAVLDIIAAQPRIAGNPYVFAGRSGPFNSFSQRKEELDEKLPATPPWVVHDLRRTARSLMARAGVRPDIAERVLGHAIPGVEGVYDRHSYADEKADALNRLGALVERIINPPTGNVVSLTKGRRAKRRASASKNTHGRD